MLGEISCSKNSNLLSSSSISKSFDDAIEEPLEIRLLPLLLVSLIIILLFLTMPGVSG